MNHRKTGGYRRSGLEDEVKKNKLKFYSAFFIEFIHNYKKSFTYQVTNAKNVDLIKPLITAVVKEPGIMIL